MHNDKKIKVLEICGGTFGTGGGSTMVWNWYQNLDLERINVDFYCFQKPDTSYIEAIQKNMGSCFVMKPSDNKFSRKLNEVRNYERKNMVQQIKAAGYDIRMSAKQLVNIYLTSRGEISETIAWGVTLYRITLAADARCVLCA